MGDHPAGLAAASILERDLNVMVDETYVLKVYNPAEDRDVVDMEVLALLQAAAADPTLPDQGARSRSGLGGGRGGAASFVGEVVDSSGRRCAARLIHCLPGAATEVPHGVDLAEQIGALCARTQLALQRGCSIPRVAVSSVGT